ncbi:MAG: hypothetical protein D6814_13660, partial [Calditrichaeota bacterium]
ISVALLFLTFWSQSSTFAGNEKSGSTAFKFLSIPVGSRLVAMGGSGIAIVNGPISMYWNTAGLASTEHGSAVFSYTDYLLDVKHFYAGVAYNFEGVGVFGLNLTGMDFGDIPETVAIPVAGSNFTGKNITSNHFAIGLSYARQFSDELAAGGTIKLINEELDNETATGVALDVGTQFSTGWRHLRIGAQLSNFGLDVKFLEEEHKLPLTFRVGFAIDSRGFFENNDHVVTLALDVLNQNDKEQLVPVGIEYRYSKYFSLRAGYTINRDETNLSFGGGLHLGGLSIDYAFSDMQFFDAVNRFSIAFDF